MDLNKNGLLFSYIDSIETPDLFTSYKIKKIPSLNQYAENYLANLNIIKSNNYTNNDSTENINDNNTSVKGLSNDNSNNETNIQTNQISKANDIFTTNKQEEINEFDNTSSYKIKTRNNLAIEHLKKNFNNKINTINKINEFVNIQNLDLKMPQPTQKSYYSLNSNINKNKKGFSELYKKISPPYRTKLNSPIFSAFKSSNSKNNSKYRNNNYDFLNLSKSVNSLNDNKFNKNKNYFFHKGSSDYSIKPRKMNKKFSSSFLSKNILTNYIYSDRDKFKNNQKSSNRKKNNQLQNNFSESHTDESFIPFNSVSYRYNANKSISKSIEDYWKEKDMKKRIKIERLRKEKIYKESCELRDRPQIDSNSRKIAENIVCNSSLNVFDRLSELAKNNLYFNDKKSNIKTETNNHYKLKLYKQLNYENYFNRNKKNKDLEKKFKSFKQIENNNKSFFEKISKEQENNNKSFFGKISKEQENNKKMDLNKFINKTENQTYNEVDNSKNILILNKVKKQWIESYNTDIKIMQRNNNLEKSNYNLKLNLAKPKIMYKKINKKSDIKGKHEKSKDNVIQKNKTYIDKLNIYNNIDKSIYLNKKENLTNKNILYNYNSNKNFENNKYNKTVNENKKQRIQSIKKKTKDFMINKIKIIKSFKNINDTQIFLNKKQKNNNLNNYLTNNKSTNFNSERNSSYKYDNKLTSVNIIKNKNQKQNNLSKKSSTKKPAKLILNKENEENIFNNQYVIKNLNKSYLTYSDNNNIKDLKNNNNTKINKKNYYIISMKNEFNKENCKTNRLNTDFFNNKTDYNSNIENNMINFNKSIEIEKNENENKCKIIHLGLKSDKNKTRNNLENYINIPSSSNHQNIEQSQNINKRRLELIKLLDFSSSIGNTYTTNY